MGRKYLTKSDIKYLKKNPEIIALVLGISFLIYGWFGYGLYNGIWAITIGVLLLIIYALLLYRRFFEYKRTIRKQQIALARHKLNDLKKYTPWEFEKIVSDCMSSIGYHSYATKGSGDKGVDVVANKNGIKIVIQLKMYTNNVGFEAVQQVFTGKSLYKAQQAWVITTADGFTRQAKITADELNVRLLTLGEFAVFLDESNSKR